MPLFTYIFLLKRWTERFILRLPASKERTAVFMSCAWITKTKTKTPVHFTVWQISQLTGNQEPNPMLPCCSWVSPLYLLRNGLCSSVWKAQRLKAKKLSITELSLTLSPSSKTTRNPVWPGLLPKEGSPRRYKMLLPSVWQSFPPLFLLPFQAQLCPSASASLPVLWFGVIYWQEKGPRDILLNSDPSFSFTKQPIFAVVFGFVFFLSFTYKVNPNKSYLTTSRKEHTSFLRKMSSTLLEKPLDFSPYRAVN